jgi:hypothetical protein
MPSDDKYKYMDLIVTDPEEIRKIKDDAGCLGIGYKDGKPDHVSIDHDPEGDAHRYLTQHERHDCGCNDPSLTEAARLARVRYLADKIIAAEGYRHLSLDTQGRSIKEILDNQIHDAYCVVCGGITASDVTGMHWHVSETECVRRGLVRAHEVKFLERVA